MDKSDFDYALYLADLGHKADLLSEHELSASAKEIVDNAPRPQPWERNDPLGNQARRVMAVPGLMISYRTFWMTRSWPDQ